MACPSERTRAPAAWNCLVKFMWIQLQLLLLACGDGGGAGLQRRGVVNGTWIYSCDGEPERAACSPRALALPHTRTLCNVLFPVFVIRSLWPGAGRAAVLGGASDPTRARRGVSSGMVSGPATPRTSAPASPRFSPPDAGARSALRFHHSTWRLGSHGGCCALCCPPPAPQISASSAPVRTVVDANFRCWPIPGAPSHLMGCTELPQPTHTGSVD